MNEFGLKEKIIIEDLIRDARSGNETAENLFYSNLTERFLPIAKCEIERVPLLQKETKYLETITLEVCEKAIKEIKKICPIHNVQWSLIRAVHILRNIVDDFILDTLLDLARNGDEEAENLLFSIIRKKLIQWIEKKNWEVT